MNGRRAALLCAALGLLVAPPVQASHPRLYAFDGDAAGDSLGTEVFCVGDVDADGCPDFAAGSWGDYVRVWSGADGSVLYTFTGNAGDIFGRGLAGAGDVNADGYDDIIVGAPKGQYAAVYSGKDGTVLYTYTGTTDGFGWSVTGLGDTNGDGYDDFAIGARYDSVNGSKGAVYVKSGKDGSALKDLTGSSSSSWFGNCVSPAGDVNADGIPDLLVGDYNQAFVYSGKDFQLLLSHKSTNSLSCVDGAGDIDGDGYDDIIVGFAGGDYATVVSGQDGSTLLSFESSVKYICLGCSVAGVGDVDGDGYNDLLVGALYDDTALLTDCGSVRVMSGQDGSLLFTLYGECGGDFFGSAVDGADLNGDGREDLIVGAVCHGTNGASAGRVYVFASPAPSAGISIDDGAAATADTSVTLSVIWSAGEAAVKEMRLRDAGDSWGGWIDLDTSVEWTLRSGEGLKKVEAQVRDEAGLTSRVMGDTIVLDQSPPSGTILLENGAAWTNRVRIDVSLDFTDRCTEVEEVRLRNEGEDWSPWQSFGSLVSFDLSAGVGLKTVEAQCRDPVGNLSDVAADSIGVDRIPPTGSASVNDGAAFTGTTFVTLRITASDEGGSGVSALRVKQATSAVWETNWLPVTETLPWEIRAGEGVQGIDVQVRDGAGNLSEPARDVITLDRTAPVLDGLAVNGGRPYVLPREPLELTVDAHDGAAGSGVASFRYTTDGGATYSEWLPLSPANRVTVERPEVVGPLAVRAMLMDAVGNRSKLWPPTETHLVEAEPPWLGSGGSYCGQLADRRDVDAVAFDMVKGDLLSVKVKASATPDRKALFPLVMDLTRPTGEWVVTGIGPRGIVAFPAPETGSYILIFREEGEGAETGDYAVAVTVKQAAGNAKWKGAAAGGQVVFDAARGSLFKASLKGPGLDAASIVVEGPDGPVAAVVAGKPGSARLSGVLAAGTGEYRIRFTASGSVTGSWSVKLPRGPALSE